jgi:tetratricopeptide (TPR) repeat protein
MSGSAYSQFDAAERIEEYSFRANVREYRDQPRKLEAIGRAYFKVGELKNAQRIGCKLTRIEQTFGDEGYLLKANALSERGKSKRAIRVFEKGIDKFPAAQLLWYNKAIVHYEQKNYESAAAAAMQSVALNINHPQSHLMLGYSTAALKLTTHSLLAHYYYLLIATEPENQLKTIEFLEQRYKNSVIETDTGYTINDDYLYGNPSADLFLEVYKNALENRSDTVGTLEFRSNLLSQLFVSFTQVTFDKGGFWSDTYIDFFVQLALEGHVEAFSYHVLAPTGNPQVKEWLDNNARQYDEMLWYITGQQPVSP